MINQDPPAIAHLNMAYNQGLGQIREDKIEIIGASLDELRVEWQPADHLEGMSNVVMQSLGLVLPQ